jgi:ribonucleotide monophosphatase NagD (HAD superfamily)
MDAVPEITIDTLLQRYDVFLLDAYGVLVHSTGALPGSIALINRLQELRKRFYVVTNDASKLPATAATLFR